MNPEQVLATVRRLKETPDTQLPVLREGIVVARLVPVTWADDCPESVALLADWRRTASDAFPSQFPVTLAGTQRWLIRQLLELPERLLFWVTDTSGRRIGHVGLFHFNFAECAVELDNILRGVPGVLPGIMEASIRALLDWTFDTLGMDALTLRVFADNMRAIRLYLRCGFQEVQLTPLVRVVEGEVIRWVEVEDDTQPIGRYFSTMALPRSRYGQARAA
jgi:RimJ/RimL family protein N-acetyltransferase